MRLRVVSLLLLTSALALPQATSAHLDHPFPTVTDTAPPLSTEFNSGGEDAEWELLNTIPDANPHSDLDFFTQQGKTYASVGVLGSSANGGGQTIIQLTDEKGAVAPNVVSNHPSASCVSDPSAALGLQHDVEATPKGEAILNTNFPQARRTDAQLLLDATDGLGRCHDQGALGIAQAPRGGLEIVDITDITKPKEIGLTSHIGQSHTVNVDPRRPHIAYSVTSDTIAVTDGKRTNETTATRVLDGWEVVDLSSCMNFPAGTTIQQKRDACRPVVYRYRYPELSMVQGHTNQGNVNGCHELELYPDDKLTCASGSAMLYFDVSGAFDDRGTPTDFTDDKPRGTPLPCAVRDTSTSVPLFKTGAKITDCVIGQGGADLGVPNWLKIGAPSLEGVKHLGSAFHQGRESVTGAFQPKYDSTQDIDFDHEAELTHSRKLVIASDERGGGVAGGAQCSPGADLKFANGGLHAYRVDKLLAASPAGATPQERAEKAHTSYARTPKGDKAIFRAPVRTGPQASFCTAHVFQQIPGQNRIFMGWYSQGTQVVDFKENADGTVEFKGAGYFVPENANQWVSHIFKVERNGDGTFTYYGATGDGIVGDAGRNGVDIYKVTLPAPPEPLGGARPEDVPTTPPAPRGTGGSGSAGGSARCPVTIGFERTDARRRGRGLKLSARPTADRPWSVDVFQAAKGRRPLRDRLVARFTDRRGSVSWNGRDRAGRPLRDGVYYARFTVRDKDGKRGQQRVTLVRRKGRFTVTAPHHRPDRCTLITSAKLRSPAFGGPRRTPLGIALRTGEAAQVTVTVRRGSKVVKRFPERTVQPNRTLRLSFPARGKGARRGLYTVEIRARRGQRTQTVTVAARRL